MLNAPAFLRSQFDRPVAVFGRGAAACAARELLGRLGVACHGFEERSGEGAEGEWRGTFGEGDAKAYGLVVHSPAFPPDHPWVARARAGGAWCLGEMDFAAQLWRGGVVAVTGSSGTATLTAFLTHALTAAGVDAAAAGGPGYPLSRLVLDRGGGSPDAIAVCHVSSHQAETLRHFRADAALWTNFEADRAGRHGSRRACFLAMWRLFERSVGGTVLAGASVARWAEEFGQTLPADAVVATEEQPGDVLLRNTAFAEYPLREIFLLAAAWWRAAGRRETLLYAAAQSFPAGLEKGAGSGSQNAVLE
jgi:UDP-N-acetylmuramoylalanine--D-glutamate ligase